MSSRNPRLRALVLAAAIVLPALPLRALPLDGPARVRDDRSAFTVFVDELRSFWHGLLDQQGTHSSTMKEGMSVDPHGGATTSDTGDNGMLIDPHG
ncbi:MAG TPA: hypothetical protein VH988_07370 [Thermoanaerobaculia bacterium]|nr:hypothetical protein [Thermoanaerobaculia bacterium]